MPKVGTNRRVSQRVALESAETNHGTRFSSQFRLARLSLRVDFLFRFSIFLPKDRSFLLPHRFNRLLGCRCHPHLPHGLRRDLVRLSRGWNAIFAGRRNHLLHYFRKSFHAGKNPPVPVSDQRYGHIDLAFRPGQKDHLF
jgi:hypothetical protein